MKNRSLSLAGTVRIHGTQVYVPIPMLYLPGIYLTVTPMFRYQLNPYNISAQVYVFMVLTFTYPNPCYTHVHLTYVHYDLL